ncbi:MAG TPA: hypothetical protein VGD45_00280 [Steroidobacter sp.]|uniref:hypothetical protein n=1 Tax=Steroidobacter sp. TaxID=1978227 RepID=UPI002EDAA844
MITNGQPEQDDSATHRLRFVTGEEAEQHARSMQERLADPARRVAFRAEQRALVQQQHTDAGRVLGLDEATERALIELLTDQQMERLEQMYRSPRAPFDTLRLAAETTRHMDALSKLLGEEGLERFLDYTMSLGERRLVGLFSERLGPSNALSSDQEDRLVALLQERTRQTAESVHRSRWTLQSWEGRELPSREQIERDSQLSALAANEESWRRRQVTDREIEARAATFLTRAQLTELSKYHKEEQAKLQRWVESAREQAGLDPKIPEHPSVVVEPEQPRIAADVQMQVEIRLKVNGAEPVVVTQTVRNGQSFAFQAADGLTAEATPTLYEDQWLNLPMTFYEQGVTGKRRLSGGFAMQSRLRDATPNGGGGTVINGRKGYAIDATITATTL